jgi:hypothetical protein
MEDISMRENNSRLWTALEGLIDRLDRTVVDKTYKDCIVTRDNIETIGANKDNSNSSNNKDKEEEVYMYYKCIFTDSIIVEGRYSCCIFNNCLISNKDNLGAELHLIDCSIN